MRTIAATQHMPMLEKEMGLELTGSDISLLLGTDCSNSLIDTQ